MTVAALYVQTRGCYWGLPGVDPWDEARDARTYAGLPSLRWGRSVAAVRLDDGFHTAEERRRAARTVDLQRLSHRQRAATPAPFRDLLLSIATTCAQGGSL